MVLFFVIILFVIKRYNLFYKAIGFMPSRLVPVSANQITERLPNKTNIPVKTENLTGWNGKEERNYKAGMCIEA